MQLKELVKKIQSHLNTRGEGLEVDGEFGPKTEAALSKYDVTLSLAKKPMSDDVPAPIANIDNNLKPALDIIKEFEGLYLDAYLDPVNIPTIGWGTIRYPNGVKVKMGDKITRQQAEEYLIFEMMTFVKAVKQLVKVPISNNAFCALVSFCYNCGAGALQKSTLLKKLNGGDSMESVANELLKWNKASGRTLKGLTRRREAERKLFLS